MLKLVLIIVLLWCSLQSNAQDVIFRVLYTEGASVGSSAIVKLDTLTSQDKLNVTGYTVLVHCFGRFVELKSGTEIQVSALDRQVLDQMQVRYSFGEPQNVDNLYLDRCTHQTKAQTVGMQTVEWKAGYSDEIFAHPSQTIVLPFKLDQKIAKRARLQGRLINIYDEAISNTFPVENTPLIVRTDTLLSNKDLQFAILQLANGSQPYARPAEIRINLSAENYYLPDRFEAKTALEALELAFHLEQTGATVEALRFYKLAASLSNHPFYNQMNELAGKRICD